MFLKFCQILGISSKCVQSVFRVCSECVQSVFRVSSECHQSVIRVSSECHQSVFRVSSECLQSVFRVCSECVQSVFNIEVISSSSASSVSFFGIFYLLWQEFKFTMKRTKDGILENRAKTFKTWQSRSCPGMSKEIP